MNYLLIIGMPINYWSSLIVPIIFQCFVIGLGIDVFSVTKSTCLVLDLKNLCCRCFVLLKKCLYEVCGKTGHHFYALIDATQPNPKILNECIYD